MRAISRIALRNIFRNRKRSFLTLTAVAFGLGALIFLRGFIFGAQQQMVENITATITNEAQIIPKELENIFNTNGAIEDPGPIREMLRQDPRIRAFSEQIGGAGIVSSATQSMMIYLSGIDPEEEEGIGTNIPVGKGRMLTSADTHGVVLGEKIREVLKVDIGDKVVVMAQDYYGSLSGESFTLVGTIRTGNDQMDNLAAIILRPTAVKLLSFEHRISRFCLKIEQGHKIAEVVEDLKKKFAGTDLRVMTWEELIPMLAQLIGFQNALIFVVLMIVLAVVTTGILNTLMMSIVERTREFGLMMALGTKPSQVIFLVTLESFLLTTAGTILGVCLGVGFTIYFGHIGIDMTKFTDILGFFLVGSDVHPRVDWVYLGYFVAIVLASNLIVSVFPAWRASRLEPIEAMRQVG